MTDWWQTLYDDVIAEMLLVRKDQEELRATVDFLLSTANLTPGDSVLDQGCGIGSLAIPLARAGLQVIGVDQAANYIARARREADREHVSCTFHVGDAFSFVPDRRVDAVLNWNTSFGNADDTRNQQMLHRAFESLRPGGCLILDYQHIARVLRHFREVFVQRHVDANGETLLLRESQLDLAAGALRQRWTLLHPGGQRDVRNTAIRLYLPHQLSAMLHQAGFVEVTYHGGIRDEPLSIESPRCILIARRPHP